MTATCVQYFLKGFRGGVFLIDQQKAEGSRRKERVWVEGQQRVSSRVVATPVGAACLLHVARKGGEAEIMRAYADAEDTQPT